MRATTIEGQSRFDKLKFVVSPVEFQDARLDTAGPIGKLPAYAPIAEMARNERNRIGISLLSVG
jgi:hypothetical protein